jgi:hypothetical protein
MNSVIKEDGQPCQCGFCRPDLNLFAVDQEIPVQSKTDPEHARQESAFQRGAQTRMSLVSVPALMN